MATYTGEDIIDLSVTTPTESATPPDEVNDALREIKRVLKNQNASIVKSSAYTLTSADSVILVSGTTTITVPASTDVSSSTFTKTYTIIKTDASTTLTIARSGSDTFNGATSISMTKQYEAAIIIGSGVADWKYLPINDLIAGTDYLTPTGDGSGLTGISTDPFGVSNKTSDYTVGTDSENDYNGKILLTNKGTAANRIWALCAATVNRKVKIKCSEYDGANTYGFKNTINRAGSDTITVGVTTLLTSLTSSTVGSTWELHCEVTGVWIASLKGVQPSFLARKTANQTPTGGAITKVTFTEQNDNNNNYASDTWTPTIPGGYIVAYSLNGDNPGAAQQYGYLYKNGASLAEALSVYSGPAANISVMDKEVPIAVDGSSPTFDVYIYLQAAVAISYSYSGVIFWAKRVSD